MNRPLAPHIYLAAALALPASAALAQQASEEDELTLVYGDKAVVSIATGNVQTLRRAPAVASVITAQDIAAMGAADLDQVLESVPGIHVNRSANNYSPLYVVRGIFSQFAPQVLLLQNGTPMTTLYQANKGNLWGGYPVNHIARIEIIRGPGSALYGSDAFSGVINIITKSAADTPGTEVGVHAGSFASKDAWVQHGGKAGLLDVSAYVRVGQTDGFRSIIDADAQTRNDTIFGTHASLAPGPVNVGYDAVDANLELGYGKWRLRAGYKLRDNLGTGAGIASALDPVGKQRSERITSTLAWADPQLTRDWGVGVSLNTLQYRQVIPVDFQLLPPGLRLPTGVFPQGMIAGPDTSERQVRLSAFADYNGFDSLHLRFGLGHDDLDMYYTHETRNFTYTANGTPVPQAGVTDFSSTNPFIFPQRRKISYGYAQLEWNIANDWTLTYGRRYDHYSDFGNTDNPRAALVWDASLDLTAKLLYGRAFRAPSFIEYYGITNPVALGNTNLTPETISTIETAFAWQARENLQVNLNLFQYKMHNIIRTVPNAVAGTGATYSNTPGQDGHGAELEAIWKPSRSVRVVANYARQRSVDQNAHHDAGYAPHDTVYARAEWQFSSAYVVSGQANHVAGRARAAGDARKPIADYTTLDLTLRSIHGKDWGLSASVRNLFNADVREPSLAPGLALPHDLPMAQRALSVQLTYKL